MQLRTLRLAAAGGFFVQGLVFISLTTRLPDVRDEWDLSEAELSGLLLMMVLLAGVGSLAAERLAKRQDSATVLRLGFGLAVVGLPTLTAAPTFGVFVAGMAIYGLSLGVVDAATNMQAVASATGAKTGGPNTPGPVGTVRLVFLDHYPKFADRAREEKPIEQPAGAGPPLEDFADAEEG